MARSQAELKAQWERRYGHKHRRGDELDEVLSALTDIGHTISDALGAPRKRSVSTAELKAESRQHARRLAVWRAEAAEAERRERLAAEKLYQSWRRLHLRNAPH